MDEDLWICITSQHVSLADGSYTTDYFELQYTPPLFRIPGLKPYEGSRQEIGVL